MTVAVEFQAMLPFLVLKFYSVLSSSFLKVVNINNKAEKGQEYVFVVYVSEVFLVLSALFLIFLFFNNCTSVHFILYLLI